MVVCLASAPSGILPGTQQSECPCRKYEAFMLAPSENCLTILLACTGPTLPSSFSSSIGVQLIYSDQRWTFLSKWRYRGSIPPDDGAIVLALEDELPVYVPKAPAWWPRCIVQIGPAILCGSAIPTLNVQSMHVLHWQGGLRAVVNVTEETFDLQKQSSDSSIVLSAASGVWEYFQG